MWDSIPATGHGSALRRAHSTGRHSPTQAEAFLNLQSAVGNARMAQFVAGQRETSPVVGVRRSADVAVQRDDEDGEDDQPDGLLAERVPSTRWSLTAAVGGQLGAGLGVGAFGLTLVNKATGTAHPLVFAGAGVAGGGKGNSKIPRASRLPSIGNPIPTDFVTDSPARVPDFNGLGAIGTAGASLLLGFAVTFAKLPLATTPGAINLTGLQLGFGASAALLAGEFHGVSGRSLRAPEEASAEEPGDTDQGTATAVDQAADQVVADAGSTPDPNQAGAEDSVSGVAESEPTEGDDEQTDSETV